MILLLFLWNFDEELMILGIVGVVGNGVGWKNVSRFLCGELRPRVVCFVTGVEFLFSVCWNF